MNNLIISNEISYMRKDFDEEVKKVFWECWPSLSEQEVDEYLKSEEAQKVITEEWEMSLRDFNAGKITRKQVVIGGGSAAGSCLEMMY